jgi:hypothetical protein
MDWLYALMLLTYMFLRTGSGNTLAKLVATFTITINFLAALLGQNSQKIQRARTIKSIN